MSTLTPLRGLLLLGALCTATLPSRAQLSLEEYRREVIRHSFELQRAEERISEAQAYATGARAARLPRLSASGDFSLNLRSTTGIKPWDFGLQPEVVATLYGAGLTAAQRGAEQELKATLAERQFTRSELRYAAEYAYWNLSAMQRYRQATEEYVEIIRSLKEVIDRRFEEGYIAKSDCLMIQARLNSAEYDLLTATENLEVALHNFNILRGMESDLEVELAESILDSAALPERISTAEVMARRADIEAAGLRTSAAEQGVRGRRMALFPRIEVGAAALLHPRTPNQNGTLRLDGNLFGRISIPLFEWGYRRAQLRTAEATVRRLKSEEELLREEVVREERNEWSALVESRARILSADKGLQIAAENLALSTYSYNEGLLTILDVLQAQLDWIELYTNAITAHFNFAVARAAYRHAVGAEE